jgi:hypothetical protein
MKRVWYAIALVGACVVSMSATADTLQFRGAARNSEAQACLVAQNRAAHWLNDNVGRIHMSNMAADQTNCTCMGDTQTGWECTVAIQIHSR